MPTPYYHFHFNVITTIIVIILLGCIPESKAHDAVEGIPTTYADAAVIYQKLKDRAEYKAYKSDFDRWDYTFNGMYNKKIAACFFKREADPINLFFVLSETGIIQAVLSRHDNGKTRCLQKVYTGLKLMPPPFMPFVLEFIPPPLPNGMIVH